MTTAITSRKKTMGSDNDEHSPTSSQADQAEDAEEEEDKVEWLTDTSVQAAQQRIQEQLTSATSEMVMLNTASDEPGKPTTNGKAGAKKSLLKKGAAEVDVGEESVVALSKMSLHKKLVKDFRGCLASGFDASQLAAHLRLAPNIIQQEAMNACFEALFDGVPRGLANEVGKKKKYLSTVVTDVYSQKLLLGAVEAFFTNGPVEMKEVEVAGLLKMLYDLDILEEEPILFWYDQGAAGGFESEGAQVRKLVDRFVDWLRNAESEDEE